MHTLISVIAAVVAGLFLAASGVLQQREASKRPRGEGGLALIGQLVRDRKWLLGILCAGASYGFQAVALAYGPLALVQPLIVSELLFAVPISVRLHGLRLGRREWLAAATVVAGLALGIVSADPRGGHPLQPFLMWLPALLGGALLAGGCLLVSRRMSGPARASIMALGGALLMGLQSGLYQATIAQIKHGFWQTFTHWQPYLLIVFSVAGALLIQKAFQAGPLAASSPVIDSTLPVVSVILGIWVLDEQVNTSVAGLVGGVAGIVLLVVGIVALDTSRVVRREEKLERQESEQLAEQDGGRDDDGGGGKPARTEAS